MNAVLLCMGQAGLPDAGTTTTAASIRDAATLTSITLAVLSAFANQRAASLNGQKGNLGRFKLRDLKLDLAVDVGLAAFGALLLLAAGPLFCAAIDEATPLLEVDTALFALFCLFYVGVGFVVLWVGTTAFRRSKFVKSKAGGKGLVRALTTEEPE